MFVRTAEDVVPSTSGGQAQKYRLCSRIVFGEDGVRVVVPQPKDATPAQLAAYSSGRGQCWQHMTCKPPRDFRVSLAGDIPSLAVTLHINPSLVSKLPLLADIASNTTNGNTGTKVNGSDENSLEVELTSSVWGIVSLLLLMEASVSMTHWFASSRAASDPVLPAQTLEV